MTDSTTPAPTSNGETFAITDEERGAAVAWLQDCSDEDLYRLVAVLSRPHEEDNGLSWRSRMAYAGLVPAITAEFAARDLDLRRLLDDVRAEAAAAVAAGKVYEERVLEAENRANRLKESLAAFENGIIEFVLSNGVVNKSGNAALEISGVKFATRASTSIDVPNIEALELVAPDLVRYPKPQPNKADIKKALESGEYPGIVKLVTVTTKHTLKY